MVSRSRRVGPLIAPTGEGLPDFFRPVELRNAKLSEIIRDPVQPRRPVLACRLGKALVLLACSVEDHQRFEPARLWRVSVLNRFVVACSFLSVWCCFLVGGFVGSHRAGSGGSPLSKPPSCRRRSSQRCSAAAISPSATHHAARPIRPVRSRLLPHRRRANF